MLCREARVVIALYLLVSHFIFFAVIVVSKFVVDVVRIPDSKTYWHKIFRVYKCMHTIFLVDDDEDDRVIFTSVLKTLDVPTQCYIAHDGLEALTLLQNDLVITPDLIFLDLNMPKLNGFGFLREIKKISGIRSIPVFIYTTSSNQRDINESFRLGAYGFVTKPSKYNELRDVLKNILQDRRHPLRNSRIIFNNVFAGIV